MCIYMHLCIIYVYMHISRDAWLMSMFVQIYTYLDIHRCVAMYVYACMYPYMYMYVYMIHELIHLGMYTCMGLYVHAFKNV